MAIISEASSRWRNCKAVLLAMLVLFFAEFAIPVCTYCGELDDNRIPTQPQSDSAYWYGGPAFLENATFLMDKAYISEWLSLRSRLNRLTPDSLSLFDEIMLLYVKDLCHIGLDACLNLQQMVLCRPDTVDLMINYGSACRAYERTHQLAPLISDPVLQTLAHDLRHKLRMLALKIEKLVFGHIQPGQDEPVLLLWMHGTGSGNDSAATPNK